MKLINVDVRHLVEEHEAKQTAKEMKRYFCLAVGIVSLVIVATLLIQPFCSAHQICM